MVDDAVVVLAEYTHATHVALSLVVHAAFLQRLRDLREGTGRSVVVTFGLAHTIVH